MTVLLLLLTLVQGLSLIRTAQKIRELAVLLRIPRGGRYKAVCTTFRKIETLKNGDFPRRETTR